MADTQISALPSGSPAALTDEFVLARAGTSYKVPLSGLFSFVGGMNAIIGGDFSTNPWQRGTSFAAPAAGDYLADRWHSNYVTSGVVTVSKSADAPTVAQAGKLLTDCLLVDVTTADAAVAVGDFFLVIQKIEGFVWRNYAQQALLLKFWHKHTKTGIYCVAVRNSAGDKAFVAEYSQAVSDTWEESSIAILASPAAGTWLYDAGVGLTVSFALMCGTNFHTSPGVWQSTNVFATANQVNALDNAANNSRFADVRLMLNNGAAAQGRSFAEELVLCQRYLPAVLASSTVSPLPGGGSAASTTIVRFPINFKTRARVAPTGITMSNGAHITVHDGQISTVSTSVAFQIASPDAGIIDITVASGLTQYRPYYAYLNNASGYVLFTGAEL